MMSVDYTSQHILALGSARTLVATLLLTYAHASPKATRCSKAAWSSR